MFLSIKLKIRDESDINFKMILSQKGLYIIYFPKLI